MDEEKDEGKNDHNNEDDDNLESKGDVQSNEDLSEESKFNEEIQMDDTNVVTESQGYGCENDNDLNNSVSNNEIHSEENIMELEVDDKIEKEEEKVFSNKNKRNISIFIGIIIVVIIFITVMISTVSKYDNIVYTGVSIYGEDVSKLDKDKLNKKLISIENKLKSNKIFIKTKNVEYDVDLKDIVEEFNKDKLCNKVLGYGKDKNIVQKFGIIVIKPERNYKFDMNINKDTTKEIINKIAKETNIDAKNPSATIEGNKIDCKEGKAGLKLDEKSLIKDLEKSIKEMANTDKDINIDAKYKEDSPKININELKKVDTKISEYSTYYGGGNGRGRNIENAARKLDDMILMPGDEFSYEDSIGPITADNGYTYASVIINGAITDGIGGGVCQVSSTMYNAQLKAGLLPTERRNHSKPVDYVPRGLDATLATGSINYKFKNTYEYPIVLNTYTSGGKLYTEFWSNKDATKGIEYKAESYISGNVANSYLYGYDKNGKRVYEKHIDTSIYR